MTVDVIIEDPRWADTGFEALAEQAATATLAYLGLIPADWDIAILACDETHIATLNASFREKPSATNVLSWPSVERGPDAPGTPPKLPEPGFDPELGDIAIAYDTCAREAAEAGKPMADHVTHLIIHATLHLLGYDHIRDLDATLMERCEVAILGKLGLSDPY